MRKLVGANGPQPRAALLGCWVNGSRRGEEEEGLDGRGQEIGASLGAGKEGRQSSPVLSVVAQSLLSCGMFRSPACQVDSWMSDNMVGLVLQPVCSLLCPVSRVRECHIFEPLILTS